MLWRLWLSQRVITWLSNGFSPLFLMQLSCFSFRLLCINCFYTARTLLQGHQALVVRSKATCCCGRAVDLKLHNSPGRWQVLPASQLLDYCRIFEATNKRHRYPSCTHRSTERNSRIFQLIIATIMG